MTLVLVALFGSVTAIPTRADAAVRLYGRKPFALGTGLRTWGYLPDNCLQLTVACNIAGDLKGKIRPEATAQSIAIFALAALIGDLGDAALDSKAFDKLDWEVGPRLRATPTNPSPPPDTALAENSLEPPGEPADPCDPAAPGGSDPEDKWRIDIVYRRPLLPATLIEVKNFENSGMVENQLNCYISHAKQEEYGVVLRPDSTLNSNSLVPIYAIPYLDNTGAIWCTWAPEQLGHIYFSLMADAPPGAAAACGGTALAAAAVLKKMVERIKSLRQDDPEFAEYVEGKVRPAVTPIMRKAQVQKPTT